LLSAKGKRATVRTVEIPREAWLRQLNEFTAIHEGWLVSLGVASERAFFTGSWRARSDALKRPRSERRGGRTMKSSDLTIVSTFPSPADAQIAKGVLDEVGIESMIRADNPGGMYPAIGAVELLVRAEDAKNATDALHRRHRRSD
jgi:hypothetical protein